MRGAENGRNNMRELIKRTPVLNTAAKYVYFNLIEPLRQFEGSDAYWRKRYASGRNSGDGSYQELANFKAEVLNRFVEENAVQSVVELGCGDGNQLKLARYPQYTGVDISETAIGLCREAFADDSSKRFQLLDGETVEAELALSLDVIYHLVEDAVFEDHLQRLFAGATRFVIIYSSNTDQQAPVQGAHVRHRAFTDWVERTITGWRLQEHIPNRFPYTGDDRTSSFADFFIYEREA